MKETHFIFLSACTNLTAFGTFTLYVLEILVTVKINKSFRANVPFLYLLKTSENLFSWKDYIKGVKDMFAKAGRVFGELVYTQQLSTRLKLANFNQCSTCVPL